MWKTNNCLNNPEWRRRRLALSCSKKLSELLNGITSKDQADFYCLNSHPSFRTEKDFKSHEKVCKNKDFCGIVMLSERDTILEFNQ